jgi:hypothetical protein
MKICNINVIKQARFASVFSKLASSYKLLKTVKYPREIEADEEYEGSFAPADYSLGPQIRLAYRVASITVIEGCTSMTLIGR